MSEQSQLEQLDPDRLLTGFSQTSLIRFLLISVVIHVVVIALTSGFAVYDMLVAKPEAVAAADDEPVDDEAGEDEAGGEPGVTGEGESGGAAAGTIPNTNIAVPEGANEKELEDVTGTAEPVRDPDDLLNLDNISDE